MPGRLKQFVKDTARRIGFDTVGIAPIAPPEYIEFFRRWIKAGYHAKMNFLANRIDERENAKLLIPDGHSAIVCGLSYNLPEFSSLDNQTDDISISRYARGNDYHKVVEEKLDLLIRFLQEKAGSKHSFRRYVDTGPILEKAYASQAGIGWFGKNSCIIHPKLGSYFFIGIILTSLELEPDEPLAEHCGTCSKCIDACPTGAIVKPKWVDSNLCISYHTIENRGVIPEEIAGRMGNLIFGCDICQEVCPWNRKAKKIDREEFRTKKALSQVNLQTFLDKVLYEYPVSFKRSPLKRAKQSGLLRNAFIAIGNSNNKDYLSKLEQIPGELRKLEGVKAAVAYAQRRLQN